MSEETTHGETSPLMHTVTDEQLRKLFAEVKAFDYTQAKFEADKTGRIKALCETLSAIVGKTEETYSNSPFRDVLDMLKRAEAGIYEPPHFTR